MRTETDAIRSVQRWLAGVLAEPWEILLQVDEGREPTRPYALVESLPAANTATLSATSQEVTLPVAIGLHLEAAASRAAGEDAARVVRELVWQAIKVGDGTRTTPDLLPLWSYTPRLERQQVRVRGEGTFVLVLDVEQTAPIAADADAATVQAALEALADIGAGNVTVSRRGVGLWDVEFVGDLAGVRPGVLDVDDSGLTGEVAASVRVLAQGVAAPWRTARDWMRVIDFGGMQTLRDPDDPSLMMVAVNLRLTWVRGTALPSGPVMQRVSASGGMP